MPGTAFAQVPLGHGGSYLMFRLLGILNTRFWPILLILWFGVLIGSGLVAPSWDAIAKDADVAFLPATSPSTQAERLDE
jgi:hypothetical protein